MRPILGSVTSRSSFPLFMLGAAIFVAGIASRGECNDSKSFPPEIQQSLKSIDGVVLPAYCKTRSEYGREAVPNTLNVDYAEAISQLGELFIFRKIRESAAEIDYEGVPKEHDSGPMRLTLYVDNGVVGKVRICRELMQSKTAASALMLLHEITALGCFAPVDLSWYVAASGKLLESPEGDKAEVRHTIGSRNVRVFWCEYGLRIIGVEIYP